MTYNFDQIIERRHTNSLKWNEYAEDVLPLWVADMDFHTPKPILDALKAHLDHGILGYEFPRRPLLEAVAARMDSLYGWKVAPESIRAVPGVVSGFNVALRATCAAGDGYLIQPPVYFPFWMLRDIYNVKCQAAPLAKTMDGNILDYRVDFDSFKSAIDSDSAKTRMFLLCNPHNPTGNMFTREQLTEMANICVERGIVVCSDEIHSELIMGDKKHIPIAALSPEIEANSITLIAASKAFNVAGLFCAFAIIPNPDLRKQYERVMNEQSLHINSLGLSASQVAFSGACDDWLKAVRGYVSANRDFVSDYARANFPEIKFTVPEATYMTWLDCNDLIQSGRIQGSPFEFFKNNARVALNDGKPFGGNSEGFVRINFACPRATLTEALERMKRSLNL